MLCKKCSQIDENEITPSKSKTIPVFPWHSYCLPLKISFGFWSNLLITSRAGGRWVYIFFVILRDGKLGGRWYLINLHDLTVKKNQ